MTPRSELKGLKGGGDGREGRRGADGGVRGVEDARQCPGPDPAGLLVQSQYTPSHAGNSELQVPCSQVVALPTSAAASARDLATPAQTVSSHSRASRFSWAVDWRYFRWLERKSDWERRVSYLSKTASLPAGPCVAYIKSEGTVPDISARDFRPRFPFHALGLALQMWFEDGRASSEMRERAVACAFRVRGSSMMDCVGWTGCFAPAGCPAGHWPPVLSVPPGTNYCEHCVAGC